MSYNNGNKSRPVTLETTKYYHFRHVVFPNTGGDRKGRSWIGYKFNNQSEFVGHYKVNEEETLQMFKAQFKPDFKRIYEMDKFVCGYGNIIYGLAVMISTHAYLFVTG